MSGDAKCKKCSQSIDPKVDHYAECEGYCACWFCIDCARLSEGDLLTFSFNIIWMCYDCMVKFRRTRVSLRSNSAGQTQDRSTSGEVESSWVENEVRELKSTVAGLVDTLAKMTPIASTLDPSPPHSTPISSLLPLSGTKACSSCMAVTDSTDTGHRQQSNIDSRFSLLLSNIDVSATESDVRRLVSQSLGVCDHDPELVDIVKLVSNRSSKSVDYISFKVVLDHRWKSSAMNPSTWPRSIRFREFINRRNDTWKPLS